MGSDSTQETAMADSFQKLLVVGHVAVPICVLVHRLVTQNSHRCLA